MRKQEDSHNQCLDNNHEFTYFSSPILSPKLNLVTNQNNNILACVVKMCVYGKQEWKGDVQITYLLSGSDCISSLKVSTRMRRIC